MSNQLTIEHLPQFDTADRMRKALRDSKVSVNEMADYLDVRRESVSRWLNGSIKPSTQTLRLWATRTNVPYEWLTWSEDAAEPVTLTKD